MCDETQLQPTAIEMDTGSREGCTSADEIVQGKSKLQSGRVVEMVAAQAAANPAATALAAASGVVSYAELDRRSNQLAGYLSAAGVGPDQLVGVSMERSPAMIIAALAIMKAGGAYVPLDSNVPAERLGFLLRDADVRVLITDGSAANLPTGDWLTLNLKKAAAEVSSLPSNTLSCALTSQNLAYVIYTSGSTGQPKGVEITHGGLANLIAWHCRAFHVTSKDRASHQAAIGFDAAVWEVWPYLAAGASVHIPPESCRGNPEALRDWLVASEISITFLATPLAERMLLLDWPKQTALRILLTGADTLHRRPLRELPFALINNYGPTECTVVATSGAVVPQASASGEALSHLPSIGRAIDNTRIYIVDENIRAVAAGSSGELCIAGAGLARGYHKRDDLTREKFVSNPFSPGGTSNGGESSVPINDRLYRTGDLARVLPDGEIEFLGRMDEQIKIRGFRIEPNEIVAALDEHPAVIASAIVSCQAQDGSAEKSLTAYVVLAAGAEITATGLREHLRKRLPDYMVPASFVCMESLPLTSNGKIDRSALPGPSDTNRLAEDNYVAPDGPVQQRLAGIIASLLRIDRIGANDNFFLLGGHSLLGTQLIARVNETFGVELPLLQIFDHPTLSGMSGAIEKLILAKLDQALV